MFNLARAEKGSWRSGVYWVMIYPVLLIQSALGLHFVLVKVMVNPAFIPETLGVRWFITGHHMHTHTHIHAPGQQSSLFCHNRRKPDNPNKTRKNTSLRKDSILKQDVGCWSCNTTPSHNSLFRMFKLNLNKWDYADPWGHFCCHGSAHFAPLEIRAQTLTLCGASRYLSLNDLFYNNIFNQCNRCAC